MSRDDEIRIRHMIDRDILWTTVTHAMPSLLDQLKARKPRG